MKRVWSGVLAALLIVALCAAVPIGNIPWSAVPSCADSGGNHLNADASTRALSCGTSVPATVALLAANQVWTASQRVTVQTPAISTATFTPNFDTAADFIIVLVHASCPCTLANPSTTPVAGQHGVIYIVQSSTGSDTIGTWGSQYLASGGTSAITLSAGANQIDVLSYAVKDSTHIVLTPLLTNVAH